MHGSYYIQSYSSPKYGIMMLVNDQIKTGQPQLISTTIWGIMMLVNYSSPQMLGKYNRHYPHSSKYIPKMLPKVRHNSFYLGSYDQRQNLPFLLHLHPTKQQQNPHKNHAQGSPPACLPACLATDRHCKAAAACFFGCPRAALPLPPWAEALLLVSAAAADNASALLSVNGE